MGAAGAFCGSAIASRIGDNLGDSRTMLSVLSGFVGEMKAATIATREAPG
jgi:tryptophan synthase alpha subunit